MKTRWLACFFLAMVVPQWLQAELPITPQSLGQIEGILDQCSQARPESAAKFQDYAKFLVKDFDQTELADTRKSTEYRESRDAIKDNLSKSTEKEVAAACDNFLEKNK